MNKISLKKLSVLGLVLTAASAVTAAIIPEKDNKVFNGALQLSEGFCNQITCVPATGPFNCTVTAMSATSRGAETSEINLGSSAILNSSKSPC